MNHTTLTRTFRATIVAGGLLVSASVTQAQQTPVQAVAPAQFQKLIAANSNITACHVVWKRVQRLKPMASVDPDKVQSRAVSNALEQGKSEEQAQLAGQSARRDAVRRKEGQTINSIDDFVRIGTSVLSKIEHPDPSYRNRSLEFSDGKNSLYADVQVKGKLNNPTTGEITSNPEDVLRMSTGGNHTARLLLGIPLNQDFGTSNPALSAKATSLSLLPNGDVSVERAGRFENNESQDADVFTFDAKNLRLSSYDRFTLNAVVKKDRSVELNKGELYTSVSATGYKQYADGIWFPSKVVMTWPDSSSEYTLVSAKFNEDVDASELKLPFVNVTDFRFGSGPKAVVYNVESGKLPSDEQVKALIKDDAVAMVAKQAASREAPQDPKLAVLPVAAGLAFMSFGGWLLSINRRKKA